MNTSSRMMSFGQEQAIHVSGAVKVQLDPESYSWTLVIQLDYKFQ